MKLRRLYLLGSLLVLGLNGCALLPGSPPTERLVLEKPGETLSKSRSGRFVIKGVSSNSGQAEERGAQGRFEWLEFQPNATSLPGFDHRTRQVLIWMGSLGQSAGSLENVSGSVRAYDDQGLRLSQRSQTRLMTSLLGVGAAEKISDDQVAQLLGTLMNIFRQAADSSQASQRSSFRFGDIEVSLIVAPDPA